MNWPWHSTMPALIYPLGLAICLQLGVDACNWSLVAFNLVLVPTIELLVQRSAPRWVVTDRIQKICFAPWVYWLYGAAQAIALIATIRVIHDSDLSIFAFLGLASSTGIMTGTGGITAAHELIHRRSTFERALGLSLLAMVSYMHFRLSHLYSHHRFVGTDKDVGTAPVGQGFPAFFSKALTGGVAAARQADRARIERLGSQRARMSHLSAYIVIQLTIYAAIFGYCGWQGVIFFLVQSFVAVHLLEAVNYVQHYGLMRNEGTAMGDNIHSIAWEPSTPIAGLLTFNLTHHSCHHVSPSLAADEVFLVPKSRKLPLGFFLMVFIALIPPLWRRIMHPTMNIGVNRTSPPDLPFQSLT